MTAPERRSVAALGAIYALRMLGLFMVLPVFALYAPAYPGYSAALAGLAIGIYGLTQAVAQIPFGMASDRFGRKRIITAGLVVFVLGSVVAALAEDMLGLVAGRALQGAGAVAAAVMALTADLTRDAQRTKAMAVIGAGIGVAFGVAMVVGPLVAGAGGLPGIFWLTAVLGVAAIAALHVAVPTPAVRRAPSDVRPVRAQAVTVLRDRQLLRLDCGIFVLHAVITATFVVLPLELGEVAGHGGGAHAAIYLGVLLGAIALMVPALVHAERRARMRPVFLAAIATLALASLALVPARASLTAFLGAMVVYFAAFNLLEAVLPSLVSRVAPAQMRGTALGVYSTAQFAGAFAGGALGGWLHGAWGAGAVHFACAALLLVWLVAAWRMRPPAHVSRRVLPVGKLDGEAARLLHERLAAVPGVREAVVVVEEGTAYLKVDGRALDEAALRDAGRATG